MFDNHHADDVEDSDDAYSVEWVRSFLESNPVWLFNAELLSKIGIAAQSQQISDCFLRHPQWVAHPFRIRRGWCSLQKPTRDADDVRSPTPSVRMMCTCMTCYWNAVEVIQLKMGGLPTLLTCPTDYDSHIFQQMLVLIRTDFSWWTPTPNWCSTTDDCDVMESKETMVVFRRWWSHCSSILSPSPSDADGAPTGRWYESCRKTQIYVVRDSGPLTINHVYF